MQLFGMKTQAWFDIWSVEHFLSGMSVMTLAGWMAMRLMLHAHQKMPLTTEENIRFQKHPLFAPIALLTTFLIAYMWEPAEFYMEAGYTNNDAITYWFQGVEFWGNRMLGDPLLTLAGGYTALIVPKLIWPARLCSLSWLLAHIFIFPHSMYLQESFSTLVR